MNRIAGIFNLPGYPVDSIEMHRMINGLKYQRTDRQNIWMGEKVGLGCIRFENQAAELHGSLIFSTPHDTQVVTLDGRIDNRQDLLSTLRPQLPNARKSVSDAEILLAAYEKWDLECPKHLVGDFAFAVWDAKKDRLLCARDHFGVKPLYYALCQGTFVFASTPMAILASGKIPLRIYEERIADFLVNPLEGIDKTSSFYVDVFRLPPAHVLVIQEGRMKLERYWELCPEPSAGLRTEEEYVDAFRERFTESVRCRLQGVSAPASMLSGGLDSSAIVGVSRQILAEEGRDPLHAFAVISNSPDTNRETSCISSVLDQGYLQPHRISEDELRQWMDELVQAIEVEAEPFDCLMNLNRSVYLHAHNRKIAVLLDGVDGDVLLSGAGHLLQLWRQGAIKTLVEETLMADGLTAEYKMGRKYATGSFLSTITPLAPDWLRTMRHPQRYRKAVAGAVSASIIERGFAEHTRLGDRLALLDSHSPRQRSGSQLAAHAITLDHPFLTVGLERYERVSSAFGIEARHPFTDVRLAEFCLGLPWQLKTRRGWTKMIVRRVMEPLLPSEVVWRKDKDSLMWQVNRIIFKDRAEYFYQISSEEQANLKPYIDVSKLMNFWHEYLSRGDEKHADLLWSGVALALWLRHHRAMEIRFRKVQV